MLPTLALLAATSVSPVVSTDWLQAHLGDPGVRIIDVTEREHYDRGHIPGAVRLDHMSTVDEHHRLLPVDALVAVWQKAGISDDTHVVLYGDNPTATGWIYMTFAAIGRADHVSMLDGSLALWEAEKRPVSNAAPAVAAGKLSVRPSPDVIVDAGWVRSNLESQAIRLLDVRTADEFKNGHLPGATLILWQDLFADRKTLKLKSMDDIRDLLVRAGVTPGRQAVTYCAIGMRASLMYWAVRAAGIPARVYVGSYSDWQRDSANPIVR